jgi:phospholipase/carboxylesterase
MKRIMAFFIYLLFATACSSLLGSSSIDPTNYRHQDQVEYFLYLPEGYSPERDWPVFVGVHGFGGSGRDCWSLWQSYADEEGFILICPSLSDEQGGWYQQYGENVLAHILNTIYKQYSIENKVFLAGFSAGAQFVQGFAFDIPSYVSGVSSISSGNYYPPTGQSRNIPFLVIIGDRDDSVRIEGAKSFVSTLERSGYSVEYHLLQGVGHSVSREAIDLTIDFFRKVTSK